MDIFKDIFGNITPSVPEKLLESSLDHDFIDIAITAEMLGALFPSTKNISQIVDPLKITMKKFSIDSVSRIAQFLAQTGHESGGYTIYRENLNYSAPRLVAVFGKYFPNEASTVGYIGHPEKIGAKVYGGRMGNGPEETGDGYTYRGRGFIQLTGKENYTNLANGLGKSLADVVAYLETLEGAAMSAGWFWNKKNLNQYADDTLAVTKLINGGTNGLAEREALYAKAKSLIGGSNHT